MKVKYCLILILQLICCAASAQTFSVRGTITLGDPEKPLAKANLNLHNSGQHSITDSAGNFSFHNIKPGTYTLHVHHSSCHKIERTFSVSDRDVTLNLHVAGDTVNNGDIHIKSKRDKTFGMTRLGDEEGTAIYAGKKNEVVVMDDITANVATNNSRQIYGKVSGLNIWENDGAGIQLGIGGRGLSPNRTSNFNTRQNGYDISADALGYPESYYSPPAEATDRIEIVRGAASLQYGTQFGGMVNFKLRSGPTDKKFQLVSRQTVGSWAFFNSFNSVGGTVGKFNYYAYYQHKQGNGWRPNSEFNVDGAYASVTYKANARLSITAQYTFMNYLAHQAGGLTDQWFAQDPRQSVRNRNWFTVNWNLGAVMADYKVNERLKFNTRFFGLMASRQALGILTYINRADPGGERDLWKDDYNNWGNETRMMYHYGLLKNTSVLLVGFRYYNGHTNREQGLGNDGSGGSRSDFQFIHPGELEYSQYSFPNVNTAIFAENIFQLSKKFSVIPGIRFENILTRANGYYNIINKDLAGNIIYSQTVEEHRKNGRSFVIGGIGVSYKHSDSLQFYANISQNYRAINFNDMRVVNPNLQVDPNLQDEKGYSADIGMRGNITKVLTYDLSFFMLKYNNRIGTVIQVDPTTFNLYRLRTNISQSRNYGFESYVELDVWKLIKGSKTRTKIAVFSNFTYVDARYVHSKEPAYNNKKVELAPTVLFKTGLTFKKNRFTASYQFSYTSKQYTDATNAEYTSNAINGAIPPYYMMDLSMEYIINKHFTLSGSINNLTNNMYFTRRADSYPGPGIIPADGRGYFVTLQVKF